MKVDIGISMSINNLMLNAINLFFIDNEESIDNLNIDVEGQVFHAKVSKDYLTLTHKKYV